MIDLTMRVSMNATEFAFDLLVAVVVGIVIGYLIRGVGPWKR